MQITCFDHIINILNKDGADPALAQSSLLHSSLGLGAHSDTNVRNCDPPNSVLSSASTAHQLSVSGALTLERQSQK